LFSCCLNPNLPVFPLATTAYHQRNKINIEKNSKDALQKPKQVICDTRASKNAIQSLCGALCCWYFSKILYRSRFLPVNIPFNPSSACDIEKAYASSVPQKTTNHFPIRFYGILCEIIGFRILQPVEIRGNPKKSIAICRA
jgi:hypothetical protein